jgi:hypothetical protein
MKRHGDDDEEVQELEFDTEPATPPNDWEDDAPSPGHEDDEEDDDADDSEEAAPQISRRHDTADEQEDPESADDPDLDASHASDTAADDTDDDDASDGNADPAEPPVHPPTRWVRVSDLYLEHKHWVNPRSVSGLDPEKIGLLAASIRRGTKSEESGVFAGIEDPLEVVQILTGTGVINLIVDGQRRYLATKFANLGDHVRVPVVDLEPEPVKWTPGLAAKYLARALDKVGTREGLSSFELSESAERLRASIDPDTGKDFTLSAVAATVGRSESWVSKILSAREHASPALILSWKKGEVTDEQFKDLAALDKRSQKKAAADVIEARKSGDLTGARTAAKEKKALALAKDKAKDTDAAVATKKPKKGEQAEMGLPPPKKAPPFAVVEDMLSTAIAHPPTHDYVKGMIDALKWDRGLMDAAGFGKPWKHYMDRVSDSKAKPKKFKK